MFYKILLYGIITVVLVALLGKTNSNTSLYTAENNAVEFIFPVWDWGHPWLYVNVDSNGVSFKKPHDLPVRFAQEKYDAQKTRSELICYEKGEQSNDCEAELIALDNLGIKLDEAEAELEELIEQLGDDIRLSKEYEKDQFNF